MKILGVIGIAAASALASCSDRENDAPVSSNVISFSAVAPHASRAA